MPSSTALASRVGCAREGTGGRVSLPSCAAVQEASRVLWVAVVLAAVAVALAVAAEWWVRRWGVQRAVDAIARSLEAEAELHVVGRPLAWHLLRRELPAVVVVADELPVLGGRATLARLRVELDTVRLEGPRDDQQITAAAGRFHLDVTGEQLLRMVTLPSYLHSFDVVPTGLRLQTVAGVMVDATVRLEPEGLLVRPAGTMLRLLPQPSFRLPMPQWPYGATVEGITMHRGHVEAWGRMDARHLVFPAHVRWGSRTA